MGHLCMKWLCLACGVLFVFTSQAMGNEPEKEQVAFLEWARGSLTLITDVTAVGRIVGDARIVALSEGVHDAAEPLQFRNDLLKYLVEKKGFTAIAIESGIVESRLVHDYVLGGSGELTQVLAGGISWTFDNLPQNASLVSWLRAYNADANHPRKVNFYGFDISGSPGNPDPNRGPESALIEALKYLVQVDPTAANQFRTKLTSYFSRLRIDFSRPAEQRSYAGLGRAERDRLTSAIEDLITLFERHELEYSNASSKQEYQWAYRAALGARQVDEWLRQIPAGLQTFSEVIPFFGVADNVRDRAQADNLDWIMRTEGAQGKVLIFAHSIHLSMDPVTTHWWGAASQDNSHSIKTYQYDVVGTYLRRRWNGELVTIGNFVNSGDVGCADYHQKLDRTPPGSIVAMTRQIGAPTFLLDLRKAPQPVLSWLERPRLFGQPDDVFGLQEGFDLTLGSAFDVLFYLDAVTPACQAQQAVRTAVANFPTDAPE